MLEDLKDKLVIDVGLYGAPDFMEISATGINELIEKLTLSKERMFWLNAGDKVPHDAFTTTLVRRMLYGEIRGAIMEDKLGELSFVMKRTADLALAKAQALTATKQ